MYTHAQHRNTMHLFKFCECRVPKKRTFVDEFQNNLAPGRACFHSMNLSNVQSSVGDYKVILDYIGMIQYWDYNGLDNNNTIPIYTTV